MMLGGGVVCGTPADAPQVVGRASSATLRRAARLVHAFVIRRPSVGPVAVVIVNRYESRPIRSIEYRAGDMARS